MKKAIPIFLILVGLLMSNCNFSTESKSDKLKRDSTLAALKETLNDLKQDILVDTLDYSREECNYWVHEDIDSVTGKKTIRMRGQIELGRELKDSLKRKYFYMPENVELRLIKKENELMFNFRVIGLSSCIGDKDKINVLFSDGSRLELSNQAEFNCEAIFGLWFKRGSKQLAMFRKKRIHMFRITVNHERLNFTCDEFISRRLNKAIDCLLEM